MSNVPKISWLLGSYRFAEDDLQILQDDGNRFGLGEIRCQVCRDGSAPLRPDEIVQVYEEVPSGVFLLKNDSRRFRVQPTSCSGWVLFAWNARCFHQ